MFRMFRNFSLEPSEIFFLKGFEGLFFESRVEHKKNEGTAASRRRERPKRPETPRGPGSGPGPRVRGPGQFGAGVPGSGPIWRRGPGVRVLVGGASVKVRRWEDFQKMGGVPCCGMGNA